MEYRLEHLSRSLEEMLKQQLTRHYPQESGANMWWYIDDIGIYWIHGPYALTGEKFRIDIEERPRALDIEKVVKTMDSNGCAGRWESGPLWITEEEYRQIRQALLALVQAM